MYWFGSAIMDITLNGMALSCNHAMIRWNNAVDCSTQHDPQGGLIVNPVSNTHSSRGLIQTLNKSRCGVYFNFFVNINYEHRGDAMPKKHIEQGWSVVRSVRRQMNDWCLMGKEINFFQTFF